VPLNSPVLSALKTEGRSDAGPRSLDRITCQTFQKWLGDTIRVRGKVAVPLTADYDPAGFCASTVSSLQPREFRPTWKRLPMKLYSTLALLLVLFVNPLHAAEETKDKADKKFYDPVEKEIEGWTVAVDPKLLSEEGKEVGDKAFVALANHLQRVKYIVPEERVAELQKLRIWLELDGELGNMQYHPDKGWLKANGHDPRLVKHVHLPRARQLFDRHMWAKHPYVVLHELAHSYHDQVLSFDNEAIIEAYENIKGNGSYEKVLLFTGAKVKHYGLNNHKEYFAESTEAYFGMNDFYPFVRAELKEHDPKMFSLLEKIWGPIK